MHIRGSAAAALALLGSLACDHLVDPPLQDGATAFAPPFRGAYGDHWAADIVAVLNP